MTTKGTVLIIEDNPFNLEMAKDLLEMAGFTTLATEDANVGIKLAGEHMPNLILMDMYMPILNGYEASKLLKANPKTSTIPIVAFTALAMEDEREKALACGCTGVIVKPIDVDRFADTIEAYLKAQRN